MQTLDIENSEQVAKTASTFKILSDPTRFRIFYLLSQAENGLCVYEVAEALDISHSAASHQLAKLEARGIVECFRHGQSVCYEIKKNTFTNNLIKATELLI